MTLQSTFEGLRVLDLATNIAGPFAAMILGDLGADVIKVERPPAGDDTRALPPRWHGEATVFLAVDRNKRSLLLDIKAAGGREALFRLLETTDVLIESFPPGLPARLGLTFDDLRARNPRLILCSVTAFGDGPIGGRLPGYDALIQAVSGMMSFTGHAGEPPVRLAPSVLDLSTGMWAAIGIMAALARRTATGGAEHMRPSLLDSAFTLMAHQVLGFIATGQQPEKLGSGAPSAAPYRVFEALDGPFMLATASDAQFARLCRVLGREDLSVDDRFHTMDARLEEREALDEILGSIFRGERIEVWLNRLGTAGLSAGRVNDLRQALEAPVTVERKLFVQAQTTGPTLLRLPIDPGGACVRRWPPRLGEHSVEVLREAGCAEATIRELISMGSDSED